MRFLSLILVGASICFASASQSAPFKFPSDFIVDQISGPACSRHYAPSRLSAELKYVAELKGLNTAKLIADKSINVSHEDYSKRWAKLLGITYGVAARDHRKSARLVVNTLVDLASSGALLNTMSPAEANRSRCWAKGDKNAPCLAHTPQHVGYTFIAMLYSAIILEEHLSASDRKTLNAYFTKAYRKFIKPLSDNALHSIGLYEFADYGLGVLAYARWTRDTTLAKREISRRKSSFLRKIQRDGYINNNSYRGYRGYWYHTLGAESAFAYAMVAREFGTDFFNDARLGPRLKALVHKTWLGGARYDEFNDKPFRGDNAISTKSDEIPHMHQMSISLPLIVKTEYSVRFPISPEYWNKSSDETIGRFVGFNADCYYQSR